MNTLTVTQGLKKLCSELGAGYRPEIIDKEYVAYKDFGNGFDIEVSGVNHNFTTYRTLNAMVCVWRKKHEIVERHFDIKSISDLKVLLKDIESRYSQMPTR